MLIGTIKIQPAQGTGTEGICLGGRFSPGPRPGKDLVAPPSPGRRRLTLQVTLQRAHCKSPDRTRRGVAARWFFGRRMGAVSDSALRGCALAAVRRCGLGLVILQSRLHAVTASSPSSKAQRIGAAIIGRESIAFPGRAKVREIEFTEARRATRRLTAQPLLFVRVLPDRDSPSAERVKR